MRRVLLVLGLAIAFLVPATTAAAADWSMAGGDAARTGSTTAEPSAFPGVLWEAPVSGPLLAAPVVARNPGAVWGATVYEVSGGTATLNALNATDGRRLWAAPISSFSTTPWVVRTQGGLAADPDRVYILITEQNGALPEWRDVLSVRKRTDGTEAWNFTGAVYTSPGTLAIASAPLLVRNLVVFGSGDGRVRALSAGAGAPIWDSALSNPIPFPVTFLQTGNALVGDFILAEDDGGRVLGLDVNGTANGDQGIGDPLLSTGDLVWSTDLGANAVTAALATPVAAFVAAGSRVVALHPAFGSPIWSQDLPAPVTGNLALAGGALVFGAADGRVRALDTTTGAFLWVRSLGTLEPWLVSTPTRILTGAGTSMVSLDPSTGDVTWSSPYGSGVAIASVSENATGKGVIYAGMSSPDRVVAFGGSSDLRAVDISLTPIPNPDVFQAAVDASIKNAGDENVSRSFRVWVNDSVAGVPTNLRTTTVPYLKAGDGVTIHIDSWNFSTGTHTLSVTVETVPGDRNPNNNAISNKFFASAGPPKIVTVWSPAFWVALVVVGVAGVGAGWLVAIGQRRREHEAAEVVRSRQEPRA